MDVYTWLYLWSIVTSLRSSLSSHCIYPQVIPQSHYFGGALRQFKNGWLQKLPLTGISQIYIYIYVYIYTYICIHSILYIYMLFIYILYIFNLYIYTYIYIYWSFWIVATRSFLNPWSFWIRVSESELLNRRKFLNRNWSYIYSVLNIHTVYIPTVDQQ